MIPNNVVLAAAVVPLREPESVDVRVRLTSGVRPSQVQAILDKQISTPTRSRGGRAAGGDRRRARSSSACRPRPSGPIDGARLADEIIAALSSVTGEHAGCTATGRTRLASRARLRRSARRGATAPRERRRSTAVCPARPAQARAFSWRRRAAQRCPCRRRSPQRPVAQAAADGATAPASDAIARRSAARSERPRPRRDCARSPGSPPRRHPRASGCRRPRGSSTPGVGEHPGVADEAREHDRDADPVGPQILADARARSRAARTWSPSRSRTPARRALPGQRGDEHHVAAAAAAIIAGASARASAIGARRLTSSIWSICSWVRSVEHAAGRQARRWRPARRRRLGRLGAQPIHVVLVPRARSHAARPRLQLVGERARARSARRPVSIRRAPRAASARAIAWPIPPVAPVNEHGAVRQHGCLPRHGAQSKARSATALSREDGHGGGEAVQEAAPADRTDLAGGEEARRGRAAELLVHGDGVMVAGAEHRLAAPVAGEHQRAGGGLAADRLRAQPQRAAQILVGRSCVARVQAHDLARLDGRRRRRRAGVGIGPSTPRTRKSPCSYSGLPPSITIPISSPPATSVRSTDESSPIDLLDRLQRRAAGQLVDHVALGGGDRHLAAERRRALRHAWEHLDALQAHADGALVAAPLARGTGRPRRHASARWRARPAPAPPGACAAKSSNTARPGTSTGRDSMISPAGRYRLGQPLEPAFVSSPATVAWNTRASPPPSAAAQTATAVPDSSSRPCAEHAAGAAADQRLRREHAVDALQRRLRRCEMGSAGEHDREVGVGARPSRRRRVGRLDAGLAAGPAAVEIPAADLDARLSGLRLHRFTILPTMPAPEVIALFGPTGVGKTAVAIALAQRLRALGEDPVAVSADALQVYVGLEIAHRSGHRGRASSARAPADLVPAGRRSVQRRAVRGARPRRDRRAARRRPPADRGRRDGPVSARCAHRAEPAAGRRPKGCASAGRPSSSTAGPEALHAILARRAPWAAAEIEPTDRQRIVRALELLDAGELEPPQRGVRAVDRRGAPPDAADRPGDGARAALRADRRPRRADDGRRCARRGAAGQRRRARRLTARKALGFEELLTGDVEAMKRRTRNYARRQLTWMRKLAAVNELDATGRSPDEVAGEIARLWVGGAPGNG